MEIFGFDITRKQKTTPKPIEQIEARHGQYGKSYSVSFDGEKNLGEVGPVINYYLDYNRLRTRSWQAYLESDLAQTILDRVAVWIIGKGLKLQCQPSVETLRTEGIEIDTEQHNIITESRFSTWANSKRSGYNGLNSVSELALEAFKNSKIAGDVLTILRLENGIVTVENIDASYIQSPLLVKSSRGNEIRHGIEFDSKGNHRGYWYVDSFNSSQFIPAYDITTGLRIAFITYGNKYKIDSERGLPAIATSLESIKKTERYKEATVGAAEEVGKLAYQVVHESFSDGEDPTTSNALDALDVGRQKNIPTSTLGEQIADKFQVTTNKTTINNPVGAKIESVGQSNGVVSFKEFYGTMAEYICASMMIPPNVAFSLYNDSFSASRAATKDWEHTIEFERDKFKNQWYDIVYRFWFHIQVLQNKIQAPGYLQAFNNSNYMVVDAYLSCRFTGRMFPHIDPLKEVNAERAKLGDLSGSIPLTTVEMATEALNGGESTSNMEQFSGELDTFNGLTNQTEPSTQDN